MSYAYRDEFPKRDLESDIISETKGNLKRLLTSMVQGKRPESRCRLHAQARPLMACSAPVDPASVLEDAKKLHDAKKAKWGIDESLPAECTCVT